MHWYALYVRSRHEAVAWAHLRDKGVETFFPRVKRLRNWSDRRQFVDFPLFPGYLFVHIQPGPEHFAGVLKARGAVTFVQAAAGSPLPVPETEMGSLRIMVDSGQGFDLTPHIKEGSRVRLKSGPFKGAQGVLEKKQDNYTFFVNVELLGRSLGARVYADDVEPV